VQLQRATPQRQAFARSPRTSWNTSRSPIYPELGKFEHAGLVEIVAAKQDHGTDHVRPRRAASLACQAELDRSQRNESGVRLDPHRPHGRRRSGTAYDRDRSHVEVELDEHEELLAQVPGSGIPKAFGSQTNWASE
jgi:hypothetical protein